MPRDELERLDLPSDHKKLIEQWLSEDRYAPTRDELEGWVRRAACGEAGALAELNDAFSGPLPIGTGGRRGTCGPGPNRMNPAVLCETAEGLARAMRESSDPRVRPKVAVVFDTRRDSARFARIVAEQLARHELEVVLVTQPRPTPMLSYAVRALQCGAGVVLSASHNPPEDNGIKIYWCDGAQVLGQTDRALMNAIVAAMSEPWRTGPVDPAKIVELDPSSGEGAQLERAYLDNVRAQGLLEAPLSGLRVVHTPLHGVGHTTVLPVLRSRGVEVSMVEAQGPDDGVFKTLRSANPEQPASFALAREQGEREAVDLVLANDPDADRLGALARPTPTAPLEFIDGNRLGVLMLDHVLQHRVPTPRDLVITTLVTTPLIGRMARAHGVDVVDDLLVGFKHHAGYLEEDDTRPCIFMTEESHGFSRGNEVRDKDGAIAALLLSEAAWVAKQRGLTLLGRLREIWAAHGYAREQTANLYAEGSAGREAIAELLEHWRAHPPQAFGERAVTEVHDRLVPPSTGSPTRDLPSNVLIYSLAEQHGVTGKLVLRPSGTEPKVKVYALLASSPGTDTVEPTTLDELIARVDDQVSAVLGAAQASARAFLEARLGSP